jgi:hypothetical protein
MYVSEPNDLEVTVMDFKKKKKKELRNRNASPHRAVDGPDH